ncbi:hypothetical protein [Rhodococcus triatomae]|nr:hypothetical protein G419_06302 [Rhodococcus triatomae BKS 15-14]
MNHVASAPLGHKHDAVPSRRHTGMISLASACPAGLTTALVTTSPVLSVLVAAGTATCVAVAGLMI